jgi:hypothetical protein
VCTIVVEDGSNNYEASALKTVSREYNRILQITPLISNLHPQNERKNTLAQICNQMTDPCNQLVRMIIVEDGSNNYDASTLRTIS